MYTNIALHVLFISWWSVWVWVPVQSERHPKNINGYDCISDFCVSQPWQAPFHPIPCTKHILVDTAAWSVPPQPHISLKLMGVTTHPSQPSTIPGLCHDSRCCSLVQLTCKIPTTMSPVSIFRCASLCCLFQLILLSHIPWELWLSSSWPLPRASPYTYWKLPVLSTLAQAQTSFLG